MVCGRQPIKQLEPHNQCGEQSTIRWPGRGLRLGTIVAEIFGLGMRVWDFCTPGMTAQGLRRHASNPHSDWWDTDMSSAVSEAQQSRMYLKPTKTLKLPVCLKRTSFVSSLCQVCKHPNVALLVAVGHVLEKMGLSMYSKSH